MVLIEHPSVSGLVAEAICARTLYLTESEAFKFLNIHGNYRKNFVASKLSLIYTFLIRSGMWD